MMIGRRVLSLLVLLVAAPSLAQAQQEFRATVNVGISGTNQALNMSIANTSTAPLPITSVLVTLVGGATIDLMGTYAPPATFNPDPGINNDPQTHAAVTITPTSPLMPGQTWSTSGGDVDGAGPTGISVTINYGTGASATNVTRQLTQNGTNWTVQITMPTGPAPVGSAIMSWTPPTENTDGTPYTNPAGYRLYWGTMQGNYANSRTINNPTQRQEIIEDLPYSTYYFVATAFNTNAAESAYSNVASVNITVEPENPELSAIPAMTGGVTTEMTAYTLIQSRDNGVMFPFGTVPIGTPCNGRIGFRDENLGALYVIPKAAVTFPPGADAELLFGRCAN